METINIKIEKSTKEIIIKSTAGRQITIHDDNKELKATQVIEFLDYDKEKVYTIENLEEELKSDKNIVSVHRIFKEIIDMLNPIS